MARYPKYCIDTKFMEIDAKFKKIWEKTTVCNSLGKTTVFLPMTMHISN